MPDQAGLLDSGAPEEARQIHEQQISSFPQQIKASATEEEKDAARTGTKDQLRSLYEHSCRHRRLVCLDANLDQIADNLKETMFI